MRNQMIIAKGPNDMRRVRGEKSTRRRSILGFSVLASSILVGSMVGPAQASDAFDPLPAVQAQGTLLSPASSEAIEAQSAQRVSAVEGSTAAPIDIEPVSNAPTYEDPATGATVYTGDSHGFVVGTGAGGTNAAYVVLEDATAPTRHSFAIGTEGDSLSLLEDGSVLVSDSSGAGINLVAAPWARDADGVELPTYYTVEGNVLTQHIDTTGAAFPVVADPTSECGIGWCSVYFNRTETRGIAAGSAEGATAVSAGCAAVNLVLGGLCAVGFGISAAVAKGAYESGNCLGYTFWVGYHGPFVEPRGTNHCP